jgi:hypothetical protein
MNKIHALLTAVVSLSLAVSLGGVSYSQKSTHAPAQQQGTPVMWSDPKDIQHRNLFYGIGGKENAPDPSIAYKFVRRIEAGTQPKIIVEDNKGRKWILKTGPEARPETTATRIVWAAGYYVDQDYFLKAVRIVGEEPSIIQNVRFEPLESKETDLGKWSWTSNPFAGTRELDGLKVLVALLRDVDVKGDNNQIRRITASDGSVKNVYYISDLGATLGKTGTFLNKVFFLRNVPADHGNHKEEKADPDKFEKGDLIDEVEGNKVVFESQRSSVKRVLRGVSVENARWMGNILSRISQQQLSDAFRAGGFSEQETKPFVWTLQHRIKELRNLGSSTYAKR